MVNTGFIFVFYVIVYQDSQCDPQIQQQGLMAFEINLQAYVVPVGCRKNRYQPGIEGEIVCINIGFEPPDPESTPYSPYGPEIKGSPDAFPLFTGFFLLLFSPLLKGIELKRNEKDPDPEVEQSPVRDKRCSEYPRQGQVIAVPFCIGIKDDRHKQQPQQENQQKRYEYVPDHKVKLQRERS